MNTHSLAPKEPILLSELSQFPHIDKVIIESLEQALYRLVIAAQGQQYYVLEAKGKALTRHNIIEIQELLTPFTVKEMFLRHQSPYDEMIGFEPNEGGNELLVPLGDYFADIDKARH